jgi:ABC-type antimicrobial peptide transport system permease subunit
MYQTRLESLLETVLNVAIGFVLSYVLGVFLYPALGHPISHSTNFVITLAFTVLSIARSYAVRRWAQRHMRKAARRIVLSIDTISGTVYHNG